MEEAALLAGGSVWYWIDDRNIVDWDNPSLKQRLTGEAWRFDNNTFPINWAWHAVNGAGFHLVGRANGLSMGESFGYGFATSMVWEYLLEFKEKVSVNDVVVTPASGLAIGEFVYWMGVYLGTPGFGHEAIDGCPPELPRVEGRFLVSYGLGTTQEARAAGVLEPPSGLPTSLDVRVVPAEAGGGVDGIADTVLFPYVSIAYRYRNQRFDDWKDRLAILHLPGLAIDQEAGPVRASLRLNLDFAGIHAAGFADDPLLHEKTVLERHGYYYARGWSTRLQVEAEHDWVAAGGSFFFGQYQSIEGLDRNQEEVTSDIEAEDTVLDYEAWLRISPWGPFFLGARLTEQQREGQVGAVHTNRSLRRYFVEVGATL